MRMARVIGSVVADERHPALDRRRILVVDDGDGDAALQLAVDAVGAGPGCRVLVADSGAAGSEVTGLEFPPVRSVVVGIVDGPEGAP
ncbi:MAG: EutN/CcmL family microcompartment protein [Gemmatimonadaceae bacterium]|nr:EutN/CcmL family microcompartment protein [Gemmatimonadaceae bacterium]